MWPQHKFYQRSSFQCTKKKFGRRQWRQSVGLKQQTDHEFLQLCLFTEILTYLEFNVCTLCMLGKKKSYCNMMHLFLFGRKMNKTNSSTPGEIYTTLLEPIGITAQQKHLRANEQTTRAQFTSCPKQAHLGAEQHQEEGANVVTLHTTASHQSHPLNSGCLSQVGLTAACSP